MSCSALWATVGSTVYVDIIPTDTHDTVSLDTSYFMTGGQEASCPETQCSFLQDTSELVFCADEDDTCSCPIGDTVYFTPGKSELVTSNTYATYMQTSSTRFCGNGLGWTIAFTNPSSDSSACQACFCGDHFTKCANQGWCASYSSNSQCSCPIG